MRLIDADKLYENLREAGMVFALRMVETAPTIPPTPNDPLTLAELREMGGEPVWVENANGGRYAVISFCRDGFTRFTDGSQPPDDMYGKSWLAYRRKPEEGTT